MLIKKETDSGKFHECVYQALVKYSENDEISPYENKSQLPRSWGLFRHILITSKERFKEKEKITS